MSKYGKWLQEEVRDLLVNHVESEYISSISDDDFDILASSIAESLVEDDILASAITTSIVDALYASLNERDIEYK